MNINEQFDPRRELHTPPEPARHPVRPYLFWLFGLLLLVLWAWWTQLAVPPAEWATIVMTTSPTAAAPRALTPGTGTGDGGNGPGAGQQGEGRGAGGKADGIRQTVPSPAASGGGTPEAESAPAGGQAANEAGNGSGNSANALPPEQPPRSRAVPFEAVRQEEPAMAQSPAAPSSGAAEGRRGFYGVDVSDAGRVLFLVDMSGSMGTPSAEEPGKTRIMILKQELKKAICGGPALSETSYRRSGGFLIEGFDHEQIQFPESEICRYHDRKAMAKAMEFIDRTLMPRSGTLIRPAWMKAAELIRKHNIRTVYFLTDGEDNMGLGAEELLTILRKELPRTVVVHCFAIGHDQDFMRKVAEARKGKYVYRP